jgi:hypothetical protein
MTQKQDDKLCLFIVDNHERVFQEILEPWMIETYLMTRPDYWECIGRDGKVPLERQIPLSLRQFTAKFSSENVQNVPDIIYDLNPLSNLLPGESSWRCTKVVNGLHIGIVPIISRRGSRYSEYNWDRMFEAFGHIEEIPKERFIVKVLKPFSELITSGKFPIKTFIRTKTKPRNSYYSRELDLFNQPATLRQLM